MSRRPTTPAGRKSSLLQNSKNTSSTEDADLVGGKVSSPASQTAPSSTMPPPSTTGAPNAAAAGTETSASAQNMAFLIALLQFVVSSVGMMLGNKVAVSYLSLPCTLVIIQVVGTLVLLLFFKKHVQPMKFEIAVEWLPVAFLFTLMIFTSMKTFIYVSVSTVIIFRNIGAIFTTIVEYFVRGVVVNFQVILSELLIVVGAVMYGWGSVNFSWIGFAWIMVNVGGQVAYGVLIRSYMDRPGFKEMSKYTMSMYNNFLALPMLLVVLFLQGEQLTLVAKLEAVDANGWACIAVTCALGFMISTTGFGLQKLVSATSFLVINNLAKFLNIGLGMMFLSDKIVGLLDGGGCLLALAAGFRYSQCMMQLNDAKKESGEPKKSAGH
jgi:hypothetical protein